MEGFITVNEASERLGVSKKTVYAYITSNWKKLGVKKVNWITYLNSEKLDLFVNNKETSDNMEGVYNNLKSDYDNLTSKYNKLQDDYNLVKDEKEQLQRQNNNLTSQINNRELALKEEKTLKEDLLKENRDLNEKVNNLTNEVVKAKINWIKKFYIVLSILWIALTVIIFLVLNNYFLN